MGSSKSITSNEELDRNVLFEIRFHRGESNAVDRWELVEKVFMTHVPEHERNDQNTFDRQIRESVERLRERGHLIGDMRKGAGRYMIETEQEFWRFYNIYVKPLKKGWNTAHAMREAAREQFPNLLQPSLFDALEVSL
jgi:hypothetical protein